MQGQGRQKEGWLRYSKQVSEITMEVQGHYKAFDEETWTWTESSHHIRAHQLVAEIGACFIRNTGFFGPLMAE